nr:hypothetical protein [Tanacetum cinerariifolium]
ITQQLQNLLPAILAQVGNQGKVRSQNGNVVNENVQENVRNVLGGVAVLTRWIKKMESVQDMSGCSNEQKVKYNVGSFVEFYPSHEMQKLETDRFHELARLVPYLVTSESRKIERYVYGLAPRFVRWNGSIKKFEKRGNIGEPSKDKNGRDDNKRARIENAFAITANPIGRENMGAWPKGTTYNSYNVPRGTYRTCFNYNCSGHFAKDCRVVPMNVNPVNVKNPIPTRGACYECESTDHIKLACPRLNRAQGPGGNRPNIH